MTRQIVDRLRSAAKGIAWLKGSVWTVFVFGSILLAYLVLLPWMPPWVKSLIPAQETQDRTGNLNHAGLPTPESAQQCASRRSPSPARTLRVIFGSNIWLLTKPGRVKLLGFALVARAAGPPVADSDVRPPMSGFFENENGVGYEPFRRVAPIRMVLEADWGPKGFLDVYANIYNERGVLVARLDKGNNYSIDAQHSPVRKRDNSLLMVKGKDGSNLLWVHFLNEETVEIRGTFYDPSGSRAIRVEQGRVDSGAGYVSKLNCSEDSSGYLAWLDSTPERFERYTNPN